MYLLSVINVQALSLSSNSSVGHASSVSPIFRCRGRSMVEWHQRCLKRNTIFTFEGVTKPWFPNLGVLEGTNSSFLPFQVSSLSYSLIP